MEIKRDLILLGAIILAYNANGVELVDSFHAKNVEIPKTAFTCENKPGDGFYADIESHCQSFHMCQGGKFESFTCPVGTVFSQNGRVCDFIYNVDCSTTPIYYNQPISEDVEIIETVVGFQTVHEDGYVIPPNPDEDLLNVTSEQPEETISTTETTISAKTEESEVEIPLIPVKILEGETVKEQEGQIPVIPLIQPVIEHKPEPEVQIPVIPLIQPVIEPKPELSILSVPEKKPTPAEVFIPSSLPAKKVPRPGMPVLSVPEKKPTPAGVFIPSSLPAKKVPRPGISKLPESAATTTEIIAPFKKEPSTAESQAPTQYTFNGKIPEPIVEDMNVINSMRDDKITYPENDDKPFFDPINPNAHQINFPASDMAPKPREKYDTTQSIPFFLPTQAIFPMNPPLPVSKFSEIPQPHMSYVPPSNNLPERVKAVVNGLIHATHSMVHRGHDHLPLHQNHLHFQPMVYQFGNQFRVIKPIVIPKPYAIKVPSVLLS